MIPASYARLDASARTVYSSRIDPMDKKPTERQARFSSLSDMEIARIYGPGDSKRDDATEIGLPGEFPFTRGIHPTMYRGKVWTMRQFAGFGSAEDTNARFKYLLAHGVNGLSTAFDMPTLMGYDADHPMSRGEVGREGRSEEHTSELQ